jgi:hypothetical protein
LEPAKATWVEGIDLRGATAIKRLATARVQPPGGRPVNTLAYSTQAPEKVGPRVEELLRTELGSPAPIAYQVEEGDAGKTTAGAVLKEALALLLVGKQAVPLFTIHFDLAAPRPATLSVQMDRQGIGCHAGPLLYTTRLAKPVPGEVSLEDLKTFGSSQFVGDPQAAAKLNADKTLVKRVNKFARTTGNSGGVELKVPRLFKLVPDGAGSMLVAATLPRPFMLGFKVSMDAKELFEIAGLVESAL